MTIEDKLSDDNDESDFNSLIEIKEKQEAEVEIMDIDRFLTGIG